MNVGIMLDVNETEAALVKNLQEIKLDILRLLDKRALILQDLKLINSQLDSLAFKEVFGMQVLGEKPEFGYLTGRIKGLDLPTELICKNCLSDDISIMFVNKTPEITCNNCRELKA
jgi:hypothetical protein